MKSTSFITLRGVRVHNLQNIDAAIPLNKWTVVTGVSGAGKSSLVFDTLYAEAQRRYLQSFSPYVRQFLERFDKPHAEYVSDLPPAIGLRAQALAKTSRGTVASISEILDYLALVLARRGQVVCHQCGQVVKAEQTADVLAALGALPSGTRVSIAFPARPEPATDPTLWANELREQGFVRLQIGEKIIRLGEEPLSTLPANENIWVLVDRLHAGNVPPARIVDSIETAFGRGEGSLALLSDAGVTVFNRRLICPRCNILYDQPQPRLFHWQDPLGACPTCHGTGLKTKTDTPCPTCNGSRYNERALSVRLNGSNIAEMSAWSIARLREFFTEHNIDGDAPALELARRLALLQSLGLGYLSLERSAKTLSSAEMGRIQLASGLASNLVQALYLFEEPSAGIHACDISEVVKRLQTLRDAGNTVVTIEHHLEVIAQADYVLDLGPGAGEEGGRLLYEGNIAGLHGCKDSPTAEFLRGDAVIEVPPKRREITHGVLRLGGAHLHNLQNISVDFPLGVLCVVTGVGGAGKRTLVEKSLYPALCRNKNKKTSSIPPDVRLEGAAQVGDVVLINQDPLPRSTRSNPATHLKIFDEIRELFADTSEARIRNFGPGHFSFNQSGGRCETCQGQGSLTVDMQFLADVTMPCPDCHGARFRKEILAVKVRSLSIAEVLDLTVRQAFRFFRAQRKIEHRLKVLLDVGLDYLRLGQPIETLAGGECQRLKLAGHLASSRKPRCLFILLEPSTGLHLGDVETLLACFERLLQTGHSLIVIEHQLDIIKCADYIIDLGPGAGPAGGRVVATGTPEEVAQVAESAMGRCLRQVLKS